MKARQVHIREELNAAALAPLTELRPDLVFAFGDVRFFEDMKLGQKLKGFFPQAIVLGCSTAGEIVDAAVHDDTLVVTGAVTSDPLFLATSKMIDANSSRQAGVSIGGDLRRHGVKAVFVLAPGLNINGSDLVAGLAETVGDDVIVTGGLAGDGGKFQKTYTLCNETIASDMVVALGMKGQSLDVSYGSQGGWQPFGPDRKVTKAVSNILYELDGRPALHLYKEYLGEKAKDLPAAGLLYPLAVLKDDTNAVRIIRTILNIDEKAGSLILAGDIPEGSAVRLMHAKSDGLIDGAGRASQDACAGSDEGGLGILVSCVGRKLVMGDDVDEEVAAVKSAFGKDSLITGFYSYGEICPFDQHSRKPYLHNQTMTVTRLGRS